MNKLLATIHGIRLAGLSNSLKALAYTRLRDKLDAKYSPRKAPTEPQTVGRLGSASAVPGGARFEFELFPLTIRFLTPDFLFISWGDVQMLPSYAIEKSDWPYLNPILNRTNDGWVLQSRSIRLNVAETGVLMFYDSVGQLIRCEEPPIKYGEGWLHKAVLPPGACIYGLGERAAGMNLRPGKYRCWNSDAGGGYNRGADPLYITIPLYLCLQQGASCLAFYDNTYDCAFTLNDAAAVRFEGGPLRYYIAFGSPSHTLQLYTELTGRAPLPPAWALGYQHSRWGFNSEAEMRRVYEGFIDNHLPLSILYMDIDFMDGYRIFTPDPQRYPTLYEFASGMRKTGTHLVAMTDPGIKVDPDWDIYKEGLERDAYCKDPEGRVINGVVWPGWVAYPDFTDPHVREWWGTLYARLFRQGVSGLWHDMNEPVSYAASGEMTLPLCTRHNMDGTGGDHRQAHNVYGMLMNRSGYEACRRLNPDKRPFILSRSGWAGMQRYSWCWTGDVDTSWQAMRQTIATVLGLGLSGQPYSGPDTGGFTGHPSTELYIRWFQLDSFLPVFRTHCAFNLPRREPWEFGAQALEILHEQLVLRYALMPYWYTLAWQASLTGEPLVRPLWWQEPGNRALWEIDDEFMVGNALLIAPVLEDGQRKRTVTLPSGQWYDLWGNEVHDGNDEIELETPLERIPVLVRAGSITPTVKSGIITLHIYHPGKTGSAGGIIYSDAGDGYGPYRVDTFRLEEIGVTGYELLWTTQGAFPWPYAGTKIHPHGFNGLEVRVRKV